MRNRTRKGRFDKKQLIRSFRSAHWDFYYPCPKCVVKGKEIWFKNEKSLIEHLNANHKEEVAENAE